MVIPDDEYVELIGNDDDVTFPREVVGIRSASLIGAWRKYQGLAQKQLADAIGVSQPAVAQIERENTKPQRRARAVGEHPAQSVERNREKPQWRHISRIARHRFIPSELDM